MGPENSRNNLITDVFDMYGIYKVILRFLNLKIESKFLYVF